MNTNMKWFLFANLWCSFLLSQDRSCLSSIDRKVTTPINNTDVMVSNNRNWRDKVEFKENLLFLTSFNQMTFFFCSVPSLLRN